jgi:hypothetical protein
MRGDAPGYDGSDRRQQPHSAGDRDLGAPPAFGPRRSGSRTPPHLTDQQPETHAKGRQLPTRGRPGIARNRLAVRLGDGSLFRSPLSKPLAVYTLATYVLVAPAAGVREVARQFHLPLWMAIALVTLPFPGRVLGAWTHGRIPFRWAALLLGATALLTPLANPMELLPLRLLSGIAYALVTASAVDASPTPGYTTSGWAIGWMLAALASPLGWRTATALGSVISLFALVNFHPPKVGKPSLKGSAICLFGLAPAFLMEAIAVKVPFSTLAASYATSVSAYFIFPNLAKRIGLKICIWIACVIAGVSAPFLPSDPAVILFSWAGLGLISLLPPIVMSLGPTEAGADLNVGALGGMLYPTASEAMGLTAMAVLPLALLSLMASVQLTEYPTL